MSTLRLRDWLEKLRADVEAAGTVMPRPEPKEGDASEKVDDRARRVAALRARLLTGVPDARTEQTDEQHARWLLAYLLDWHRREDKAGWWEYYRLRDLPEEDLFDEPQAVAGLEHVERLGFVPHARPAGSPRGRSLTAIDTRCRKWRFVAKDELKLTDGKKFAEVVGSTGSRAPLTCARGRRRRTFILQPRSLTSTFRPDVLEDAIFRVRRERRRWRL